MYCYIVDNKLGLLLIVWNIVGFLSLTVPVVSDQGGYLRVAAVSPTLRICGPCVPSELLGFGLSLGRPIRVLLTVVPKVRFFQLF